MKNWSDGMKYDEIMVKIIARMLELDCNTVKHLIDLIYKNQIKYLIAFDMGCGNSSAVVYNLEEKPSPNDIPIVFWDDTDNSRYVGKFVSIPTLNSLIPSCLTPFIILSSLSNVT